MESTLEILKGILSNELGKYNTILEQLKPLVEEQRILEEKIEHYKKLVSLEGGEVAAQPTTTPEPETAKLARPTFRIFRAITRDLVVKFDGEFTINDIKALYEEKHQNMYFSKHSFYNMMNQMVQEGSVKIIAAGVGRSPSRYVSVKQIGLF